MLIVLSPAKRLDFDSPPFTDKRSAPRFANEAARLVARMRKKSPREIAGLMKLSPKLAALNHERYRGWREDPEAPGARQAVLAFKGDVYRGLDVAAFTARDFNYAQNHLRILSGLYGVLCPLDVIQPYRLEMGTALATDRGEDLYDFWGSRITDALNETLAKQRPRVLVNLASKEYFSAVDTEALDGRVISPVFKDAARGGRGDKYRIVSFYAKYARGLMAAWLLRERVSRPQEMERFSEEGYRYSAAHSSEDSPAFIRDAR